MREREVANGVRDGLWLSLFGLLFRRKPTKVRAPIPDEPPHAIHTIRRGHETSDASAAGLGIFAICMAIVLILISLAPIPILRLLSRSHDRALPRAERQPLPPPPHLGPPGDAEIIAMRERDIQTLNSYGWVDRKSGIAHVPVESVIPRVAAELKAANTAAGVAQTSFSGTGVSVPEKTPPPPEVRP